MTPSSMARCACCPVSAHRFGSWISEDPSWMVAVATRGSAGVGERWRRRAPITEGVSGRVISTGQTVVIEDYPSAQLGSLLAPPYVKSMVGVPLRERGRVIGSLLVGWRQWRPSDPRAQREPADRLRRARQRRAFCRASERRDGSGAHRLADRPAEPGAAARPPRPRAGARRPRRRPGDGSVSRPRSLQARQ